MNDLSTITKMTEPDRFVWAAGMPVPRATRPEALSKAEDGVDLSGGLLFLDLDGVLIRKKPPGGLLADSEDHFGAVARLEAEILIEQENLGVVVSSTRREGRTLEEVRGIFTGETIGKRFVSEGIARRVVGATPRAKREGGPSQRGWEILAFLRAAGLPWKQGGDIAGGSPWVVVDDFRAVLGPVDHRCIFTNETEGLTRTKRRSAQGILEGCAGVQAA